MSQRHRIQRAVRLANLEPSRLARLDFVDDAVIDVFERRSDNASEAVTVFADEIDTRLQPGLLSGCQQSGRLRPELWIILVQRIQQQQITEMEQRGLYFA